MNYCNYQTQKEKDTLKEAIEKYKEELNRIRDLESNSKQEKKKIKGGKTSSNLSLIQ
jgi:hypothetical protein